MTYAMNMHQERLAQASSMRAARGRFSLGFPNPRRAIVKTADTRERLEVDEVDESIRPRR